MKKTFKILIAIFTLLILNNYCFAGNIKNQLVGEGTDICPYEINSQKDLEIIRENVKNGISYENEYFKFLNDIEIDKKWEAIGTLKDKSKKTEKGANILAFSGIIDGNGKSITFEENSEPLFNYLRNATLKNFNIKSTFNENPVILKNYIIDYGITGKSGKKDVKYTANFENVNVETGIYSRGIYVADYLDGGYGIALNNKLLFMNCKVGNLVKIGCDKNCKNLELNNVGSFAFSFVGRFENCESYATIYGKDNIGGIAGIKCNAMGKDSFENCLFDGHIISTGNYVGGIVGSGYNHFTAPNAYCLSINKCEIGEDAIIEGKEYVAGLIGGEFVVQNWSKSIVSDNIIKGKLIGDKSAFIIAYLKSLNKMTVLERNIWTKNEDVENVFYKVEIIDTDAVESSEKNGVKYICTKDTTDGCPNVDGCIWKKGLNRTDDPLGKDKELIARMVDG